MNIGRIRQKRLEILLSNLSPPPNPKLKLETYTLDSESASRILNIAGLIFDDIYGKRVIDLGCGTGVLAIGAGIMGAEYAVGVDIDRHSIRVAKENAGELGVRVDFVCSEIGAVMGSFDTTIMNPPFGSWCRGADVIFLEKAMEVSDTVYSLHKRSLNSRRFLTDKVISLGGRVDSLFELEIALPKVFNFHRKRVYKVEADLYRILSYT